MPWRWPWARAERRETATTYSDLVARLIASQAEGQTIEATATAAIEAASGALSRAFAGADVKGPDWTRDVVTPVVLAQIGRDLVRVGESLHVIRLYGLGDVRLVPCSSWYWEGGADPAGWRVTATAYGPSGSETWNLATDSVIFAAWGSPTARPWHGVAPSAWASTTARIAAATDKSLGDEASGPLAQLLTVPDGQDAAGDDDDSDSLAGLRADIKNARGRALLLETTASGYGEGRGSAPVRDWDPRRLGPAPTAPMVELRRDAFSAVRAAAGVPPPLFLDSDGTSQREALRRWHLGTVLPLARLLEHELKAKLDSGIVLAFDSYAVDMVSRAQVVAKLTGAGVDIGVAMAAVGLDDED